MRSNGSSRSVVRRKLALVTLFAILVVFYGIVIIVWIKTGDSVERHQQLLDYESSLKCLSCFDEKRTKWADDDECQKIKDKCQSDGWKLHNPFPQSCVQNEEVQAWLKTEVQSKYENMRSIFEKFDLQKSGSEYLARAVETFYSATNGSIIHWSPRRVKETEGWETLQEFISDDVFPLTLGPKKAFRPGGINIVEDGLYLIYARLTFACKNRDRKEKRIVMEIRVSETAQEPPYLLLQDMQTATCDLADDLITMHQSGIFRLQKGYVIITRYKAPKDVVLSQEESIVKSNIGLLRLGLV